MATARKILLRAVAISVKTIRCAIIKLPVTAGLCKRYMV